MKYFLSFIEEGIFDPKYEDYVGGRIEIWTDNPWADDEFRFLTKRTEGWGEFRNKWDFKDVSRKQLEEVKKTVKEKFHKHL